MLDITDSWGKHYQVMHDIAALYITIPKYVYFNISSPSLFRSALNLRHLAGTPGMRFPTCGQINVAFRTNSRIEYRAVKFAVS